MAVLLVPLRTTSCLALLLGMLAETELWTTIKKKKKVWTRFNALLQTAYSVITYAFPFFPFSCYFLFTCTISEHLQKETNISLSLKTCIGSFNGSKTNIFLLMHTEFLFHLVSASHFKMQIMYWPVKESG